MSVSDAWEWLPSDEVGRPLCGIQLHDIMKCTWSRGARVRVWLPGLDDDGIVPCVGVPIRCAVPRALLVQLIDRKRWVGYGDLWRWLNHEEIPLPQERLPLALRARDEVEWAASVSVAAASLKGSLAAHIGHDWVIRTGPRHMLLQPGLPRF